MHRESKRERERETEKLCEQVWVRDGDKREKPKEKREKKATIFSFSFFLKQSKEKWR